MDAALRKLMDFSNSEATRVQLAADGAASNARHLIFVLLAIAATIGCIIALLMTRAITRPLQGTVVLLREIGGGRLDNPIDTARRDEVGELLAVAANPQAIGRIAAIWRSGGRLVAPCFSRFSHAE